MVVSEWRGYFGALMLSSQGDGWLCGAPSSNCSATTITASHPCAVQSYSYGLGPWMTSNVCDWYGVACADEHVVALCLVKNRLNGTLVGLALPQLRRIAFSATPSLSGGLPAAYETTLPLIAYM